jgi:hypothetical protein
MTKEKVRYHDLDHLAGSWSFAEEKEFQDTQCLNIFVCSGCHNNEVQANQKEKKNPLANSVHTF